jgi:hypothetical protein
MDDQDALLEALDPIVKAAKGGAYGPRSPAAIEALENAQRAVEEDPVCRAGESAEREWARDFWQALMLARDLETLEALLDGEQVPLNRLDPVWMARFGRRTAA